MEMYYNIADLTVEMDATGRTAQQAAAYLAAGETPPEMTVSCDPAAVLARNPELGNLDDAFYLGTGADFARKLLAFDGLQLHASALAYRGFAYLFSGPSGLGKSTHAALWQLFCTAEEEAAQVARAAVTGSGNAFRPDASLTRGEMAAMLCRAFGLSGGTGGKTFTDGGGGGGVLPPKPTPTPDTDVKYDENGNIIIDFGDLVKGGNT